MNFHMYRAKPFLDFKHKSMMTMYYEYHLLWI